MKIWFVIRFLFGQNFHAKQIVVLSSSMKLGPGVSDQQSVGSSPGLVHCVLQQDIYNVTILAASFRREVKL